MSGRRRLTGRIGTGTSDLGTKSNRTVLSVPVVRGRRRLIALFMHNVLREMRGVRDRRCERDLRNIVVAVVVLAVVVVLPRVL